MAQIPLIFPPDKKTAARQVEAALESAGYRAILEPVVEPDGEAIVRKASDCAAALLIWSRSLAASADLGGWLPSLRRLPNLIEVSTDGIAPQSGDERRVVLLSGWRGQPFHLGWRRIIEELERLGARREAPGRSGLRPAAVAAGGPATERQAVDVGAIAGRRRLALPAAAALAVLAVAGATLIGTNAAHPPLSTSRPLSTGGGTTESPPEAAPVSVTGSAPAALQSSPLPPSGTAAPEPDAAGSAKARPPVQVASRLSAEAVRAPAKRRSAAAPPLKRYSKKHSKTMRLFCARSGRSTPQCHIFARSARAGRS